MEQLRSPGAPLEVSQDRWTHGCANFPNAPVPTLFPCVASLFMRLLCMCVRAPAVRLAPPATALIYHFRLRRPSNRTTHVSAAKWQGASQRCERTITRLYLQSKVPPL